MLITTEGVVISARDSGDNDRWIKVLSPELGLIDVSVKGAKKLSSGNNSSTQLFACSKFCLRERSGRYYINSSEPVKIFYGLRLDMQKLALASYFAEIISYAVTSNQSARDVYRLFLNCMYMLSEKNAGCRFIKFVFEMRITADLGMMPGLLGCDECYRSDIPLFFLIKNGLFLCDDHMQTRVFYRNQYNVELSPGMVEAMRFVCLSEMERLFSFRLSDDALKTLGYVSELYAREQFDKHFPTLDFYKEIASAEEAADASMNKNEK